MSLLFQPMPLQKRLSPFNNAEYVFELKYDGFRALAAIENGRCQLISRNGHAFASFADLAKWTSTASYAFGTDLLIEVLPKIVEKLLASHTIERVASQRLALTYSQM